MTTARELLTATDLLLLDFDGPVTKLLPPPGNAALTDKVRGIALALGIHLDPTDMTTTDHLAIIRAAHRSNSEGLRQVESEATRLEIEAARISPVIPGVRALLDLMQHRTIPVVMITNNSPACVQEFLQRHDLDQYIASTYGRDPEHLERMKPSPWMPINATKERGAGQALMIGDSVSDIVAADAAGLRSIGLAKNESRNSDLRRAGASATVSSLMQILCP